MAWCHGAPGIGLSRLRSFKLNQDNLLAQEAVVAANTTMRYLQNPQTGVLGGAETPTLLLGTAGISLFYLRLNPASTVAPVLMVGPGSE